MKKRLSIVMAGAAALLLAASCQIAEIAPAASGSAAGTELTFTAGFENDGAILLDGEEYIPETKTARVVTSVYWTPNDEISIFYGAKDGGGFKFVSDNTELAKRTTFRGSINAFTGGVDGNAETNYFWGVYPYSEDNSCDGNSVTLTIPRYQKSAEDTFSVGQWPTVGRSTGLVLSFRNVACGYKFKVETPGIEKVEFRLCGLNPLSGTINVGMDANGDPVINSNTYLSNSVEVVPEDGGTFKTDKYYYATMIPGYFQAAGIDIHFYKEDKEAVYHCVVTGNTPEFPSGRGVFKKMDDKDHGLTWTTRTDVAYLPSGPDFYDAIREKNTDTYCSPSGQLDIDGIRFRTNMSADRNNISVKGAPIEVYYENNYLWISTPADKYVADEDCSKFLADLGIVSIKGLETIDFSRTKNFASFFRNDNYARSLPVADMDMSSAEWIEGMFEGCSVLEKVDLSGQDLSNVNSLSSVFSNCESLETIDLSGTKFGEIPYFEYTFYGCHNLKSVDMSSVSTPYPYTLGINCEGMFADCPKLSNVYFGEGFRIGQSSNDTYDSMFGIGSSDTGIDDPDRDGIYTNFHCTPGQAAVLKAWVDSNHSDAYRCLTVIPGDFSVSATKKVRFSGGNLTYTVDTDRWGFFENQYDHATTYDANLISLFTWGCGAWSKVPNTSMYSEAAKYGDQLSYHEDWGSRLAPYGKWRTLSRDEWAYLVFTRTMKYESPRYYVGAATFEGKTHTGLYLYPDNYDGDDVSEGSMTWAQLNDAGIVLLPFAYLRAEETLTPACCYYWSIDHPEFSGLEYFAGSIEIYTVDSGYDVGIFGSTVHFGSSVRIVTDVN